MFFRIIIRVNDYDWHQNIDIASPEMATEFSKKLIHATFPVGLLESWLLWEINADGEVCALVYDSTNPAKGD